MDSLTLSTVLQRLQAKAKPISKYGRNIDQNYIREVETDRIRLLERSMEANLRQNAYERAASEEVAGKLVIGG